MAEQSRAICPKCEGVLTVEQTEYFESRVCESCLDYFELIDLKQCCRSPKFELRKLIISGGGVQVRNQCVSCGFVDPKSMGGFTQSQREGLKEVDTTLRIKRDNEMSGVRKASFEVLRKLREEKVKTNSQNYREIYLQSPEWKLKRRLVLQRDKFVCQSCGRNNATDAHHLTYEMIGNEPLFHLISLCRNCHEAITEVQKIGATNLKIVHQ